MEDMQDVASVLVPVYNKQQYLQKCLESLLNQSYSNIEVIIVDDGSSDLSLAICRSYAAKDKRVRVLVQENKGVSSARNKLLSNAHGKYIFWVDPDDYVEKDLVKDAIDAFQEYNADIILFGVNIMDGTKCIGTRIWDESMDSDRLRLISSCVVGWELWGRAYKREIWNGIRFDDSLKTCEDSYVSGPLMKKASKVAALPGRYYYWQRQSHGSLVQTRKAHSYIDEFIAWKHNAENGEFAALHKNICLTRTLIACLKAILKNKKDHSIKNEEIHKILVYYEKNSSLAVSAAALLFYEYMEEVLSAEALGYIDQGPVKKALKLYCLNMVQPMLSDSKQTEIKYFIMVNQSVKLKSKYELLRHCILNDKTLACRLFGRLLSMKY